MKPTTPSRRALLLALLAGLGLGMALFVACGPLTGPGVTPTPTRTPRPPTPTSTPTPAPTPTPAWPVTVFIPEGLPAPLAYALNATLAARPDLFALAPSAEAADVQVVFSPGSGVTPLAEWVYAIVAPFPTLTDGVAWADVVGSWGGTPAGPFAGRPLLMTAGTAATLATVLGEPAPGAVEVVPAEELAQRAWETRPAWAIVPFDQLEPRWKALRVDSISVLDKGMDAAAYPLVVRIGVTGPERGVTKLQELLGSPVTNRDPAKITVLVMTGVTALTRGTALAMERNGVTFPAQDIRDWLVEADITHVSNEVSFAENCPPPASYTTMVFCSSPRYIELLEDVGVDVVELTGNHLLDWGVAAMENSERAIPYFGGGWNLAQAQTPLTLTSGVHTFGFVGCNPVGPASDWATADRPGAAPCDYGLLYTQIRQLRERGIIPIVTLQYWERQEFVDRHIFYDGRHISTELLTALLEDYARPRPMTTEEREGW